MEHELTAQDIRHVEAKYEYDGDRLHEKEITDTETVDHSYKQFSCSCGEDEMSAHEAINHIESASDEVKPETFDRVARQLFNGERINTGKRSNGFVLKGRFPDSDTANTPMRSGVGVGISIGDGEEFGERYIVAFMRKGTETRGRNSPKLKTRQAEYVKASFYGVDLDGVVEDLSKIGELCNERGKSLDRGYVNGYRTTPIRDVLDDLFKWYSA